MKKRIIFVIITLLLLTALSGCKKSVMYTVTPSPIPSPTATATIPPTPSPTPIPDNYLTLEQAHQKGGYFIKHNDYFIDIKSYSGFNMFNWDGGYAIFPTYKYPDAEMLKLNLNTDKIVFCGSTLPQGNRHQPEITPCTFYGYAPPVYLMGENGVYSISTKNNNIKIQELNSNPITDDMFINDPQGFYITDEYGKNITFGGYDGAMYISLNYEATSSCYKVRHEIDHTRYQTVVGMNRKFDVTTRLPLSISTNLTTNGYMEIIFEEALSPGVYAFSTYDFGKREQSVLFQVCE